VHQRVRRREKRSGAVRRYKTRMPRMFLPSCMF
jgi:hypothetical protein